MWCLASNHFCLFEQLWLGAFKRRPVTSHNSASLARRTHQLICSADRAYKNTPTMNIASIGACTRWMAFLPLVCHSSVCMLALLPPSIHFFSIMSSLLQPPESFTYELHVSICFVVVCIVCCRYIYSACLPDFSSTDSSELRVIHHHLASALVCSLVYACHLCKGKQ